VEVRAAVVLRVPSLSRILRDLHPVVLAILNLSRVLESLGKELSKVVVIRGVLETQVADICQILREFLGEALAEILDSSGLLLLTNLLVLLLVGSSLQTLPGEAATKEVQENVAEGFEIVSTGLLASQMSVDTHVSGGSRQ
jgi:hypothetical protein